MPLECDGKEILEFKGIYLQKAFASKIKRQIPYTKVTKFLPLNSRGNLCNSVVLTAISNVKVFVTICAPCYNLFILKIISGQQT